MIQARLKGAAPAATSLVPQAAATRTETADLPPPPALVADLIARRAAVVARVFEPRPMAGQVVQLQTVAVLLNAPQPDGQSWSGWLVSPDTDYAAWWDLLLDHRDEPFDPSAGMVQVWNRVHVRVPVDCRVLAQLSAERLADVRAMAVEFAEGRGGEAGEARPGFIAPRPMNGGSLVLTGTPLGDARDPRRIHQSLYAEAASRLGMGGAQILALPPRGIGKENNEETWAEAALVGKRPEPGPKARWSRLAAWAILLLALVLLILFLARVLKLDGAENGAPTAGASREDAERIMSVRFPDSVQARQALDEPAGRQLRVLDGPNADGEYLVAMPARESEQLVSLLRARGATVSAVKM